MTKKPLARLRIESSWLVSLAFILLESTSPCWTQRRERWAWGTADLSIARYGPNGSGESTMMWVRRSTVSRRQKNSCAKAASWYGETGPRTTTSSAPPNERGILPNEFLCWISSTTLFSCGGMKQSTSTMKTATTARENGVGGDQSPYPTVEIVTTAK